MSKLTIWLGHIATILRHYDNRTGKCGDSYDNPRPKWQLLTRSYHARYFRQYKDANPTYDIVS